MADGGRGQQLLYQSSTPPAEEALAEQVSLGGAMNTRISTAIRRCTWAILAAAWASGLVTAAPVLADADDSKHDHDSPARLVHIVRNATRQLIDVNAATNA